MYGVCIETIQLSGQHRGRRKKLSEVLLYSLEQGPTEKTIIEQCVRRNRPLPKAIQDKPQLMPGLELFFTAFVDLNTCRGGMGDGPIPWIVIQEYCDYIEVHGEQRMRMHACVRAMDIVFLEHHRKKIDGKRA